MQFVYPAYLFGLFLILIPVMIHLFKLRRYRTVYFSSLRFLADAEQSTRNRSRLQDLLLLLIRILILTMLVLAFAQPYIPGPDAGRKLPDQRIAVYIDPSYSMSAPGAENTVWDEAKKQAKARISSFPLETAFILLNPGQAAVLPVPLNKQAALEEISALQLSSYAPDLPEVLQSFETKPDELLVFSDFQAGFLHAEKLPDSLTFATTLFPVTPASKQNLYVDTCWLTQPVYHLGSRIELSGYLVNEGSQGYQQFPVELYIGDSLSGRASVDIEGNSRQPFTISYIPTRQGIQAGELRINDYPVDFDNRFYFSLTLNPRTSICQLFGTKPNRFIQAAFEGDSAFAYQEYPISAYPQSSLNSFQTVILSDVDDIPDYLFEQMLPFIESGGNLVAFAPVSGEVESLNRLASACGSPVLIMRMKSPGQIRFSDDMQSFHEQISLNPGQTINWPSIMRFHGFSVQSSAPDYQIILESQVGRPLWISRNCGMGMFSLASFALDATYTDFPQHPLFIPLIYYLSTTEVRSAVLYQRLNDPAPYPTRLPDELKRPISLVHPQTNQEFIPQQEFSMKDPDIRIYTHAYRGQAGHLLAMEDDRHMTTLALNHERSESIMTFYSGTELLELLPRHASYTIDSGGLIGESSVGYESGESARSEWPLWRWLLAAALLLLVAETAVYRLKR